MGCQDLQSDVVKIDQPESTDPCSSEHVGSVTPDPAQPHHHHKRLPNPSLSFGSKEEPERHYDQWECRVAMAAHTTRGWLALHGNATAGGWPVLTYSFLESCSLIRGSHSLGAAAFPFPPAFTETAAGVVSRGRSAPSEPVVPPVWLHCGTDWPICSLIGERRLTCFWSTTRYSGRMRCRFWGRCGPASRTPSDGHTRSQTQANSAPAPPILPQRRCHEPLEAESPHHHFNNVNLCNCD